MINLVNLFCYDYNIEEGTLLVPFFNNLINYKAVISTEGLNASNFRIYLLDSKKGFRYEVDVDYVYRSNQNYNVEFSLNQEAHEYADIDIIEFECVSLKTEVIRKEIKIKILKGTERVFDYKKGDIKIIDSNLLSQRVQMAFPRWSTVRKNTISNASKLLEPLHTHFGAIYSKVNEYYNQSYSNKKSNNIFERVYLRERPQVVTREDNGQSLLKETSDINLSIKKVEIDYKWVDTLECSDIYLEPFSDIIEDIYYINTLLPSSLYFKKNSNNTELYSTCVIRGIAQDDSEITESLLVRQDIFTKLHNNFKKIFDIDFGTETLQISNYVSCVSNHYIVNNLYINPPVVDSNFRTFKPLIKRETNNENNNTIISIYNQTSGNVNPVLKYNLALPEDNKLTSLLVTDDLDVLYTIEKNNESYLAYSKLNIDYSHKIYDDITLNNNEYIYVSDENTNYGDWFDVTVKIEDWIRNTEDTVFIVQIKNKDSVYYYDASEKTITSTRTLNYKDHVKNETLHFSLCVENDQPYIVSLISSDFKNKVSAMSVCNVLKDYKIELLDEPKGKLLVKNDMITISDNHYNNIVEVEGDYLIILDWCDYPSILYKITFGDYYIDNFGSNIKENLFEYINKNDEAEGPLVIRINKRLFKDDIKIGAGFNLNFGELVEGVQPIKIKVKTPDDEYLLETSNAYLDSDSIQLNSVVF